MKKHNSFLIGFFTAISLFIIMGLNQPAGISNKMGIVGKFRGFSVQKVDGYAIYRINTITGQIEKKNRYDISLKEGLSKKEGWEIVP